MTLDANVKNPYRTKLPLWISPTRATERSPFARVGSARSARRLLFSKRAVFALLLGVCVVLRLLAHSTLRAGDGAAVEERANPPSSSSVDAEDRDGVSDPRENETAKPSADADADADANAADDGGYYRSYGVWTEPPARNNRETVDDRDESIVVVGVGEDEDEDESAVGERDAPEKVDLFLARDDRNDDDVSAVADQQGNAATADARRDDETAKDSSSPRTGDVDDPTKHGDDDDDDDSSPRLSDPVPTSVDDSPRTHDREKTASDGTSISVASDDDDHDHDHDHDEGVDDASLRPETDGHGQIGDRDRISTSALLLTKSLEKKKNLQIALKEKERSVLESENGRREFLVPGDATTAAAVVGSCDAEDAFAGVPIDGWTPPRSDRGTTTVTEDDVRAWEDEVREALRRIRDSRLGGDELREFAREEVDELRALRHRLFCDRSSGDGGDDDRYASTMTERDVDRPANVGGGKDDFFI